MARPAPAGCPSPATGMATGRTPSACITRPRPRSILRNSISLQGPTDKGYADVTFAYGTAGAGWLPIAGDWNGPGSPLMAAGGPVAASANVPALSQADLRPIIHEAIARWASAGLDAATLAKLAQVQVVIGDLPGSYLGKAEGNQIYIDTNAAGYGWFVDPTPALDEEFASSPEQPAIAGH